MTGAAPRCAPMRVRLSGGFVFLLALLIFLDNEGVIAAAVPAVIAHELSHAAAMRLFGARPVSLSMTCAGLSLDYSGFVSPAALFVTALSGPLGGAVFAFISARTGQFFASEYLTLCGGIGLVLSIFNLLPALPLDGGLALELLLRRFAGERTANVMLWLGIAVTAGLIALGTALMLRGFGAALLLSGVWLGLSQRNRACK